MIVTIEIPVRNYCISNCETGLFTIDLWSAFCLREFLIENYIFLYYNVPNTDQALINCSATITTHAEAGILSIKDCTKITWYSVHKMSSLYGTFADSLCQVILYDSNSSIVSS